MKQCQIRAVLVLGSLLFLMLNLIMDLLWMILPLFLVCAEAENVTEVKVELGQNIILNCSGDNSDTYWYMEIHSQVKGWISRTFGEDPAGTKYYVSTLINKYSALENRLIITNITAEDCRLYYCAKKINSNINFVDTIHLVSDVPISPSTNSCKENDFSVCQKEFVIYTSFPLTAFFLVVGLVCLLFCLKKKKNNKNNCNNQVNEPSPDMYENSEAVEAPQYEEIQFSPYGHPPPAAPTDCIYSKVRFLHSTQPGRW